MSFSAAKTHLAALLGTERFSVQPVAMSVTVSVNANWPAVLPPSWETRSISTNPGWASSQSAQVRTGIWRLSSDPGLVAARPLSCCVRRWGASRRSMVAADINTNSAAVSSSITSSPKWRNTATSSSNIGASRLPAGIPSTVQHTVSAAMTSGPYFDRRGRLGDTKFGLQRRGERLAGMATVPARGGAQLIENDALCPLVRQRVADRDRLGHCPALGQCQPHHVGLLGS